MNTGTFPWTKVGLDSETVTGKLLLYARCEVVERSPRRLMFKRSMRYSIYSTRCPESR